METQREHSKELILAAAPVIVAAALRGPKNPATELLAVELALALKEAKYYEEDALDLLDATIDALDGSLDESLFFNMAHFAERLWDTVRAECRRLGQDLVSPATYAAGKAEIAEYERKRGL